jgi:hypothetical protein
MVLRRLRGIFGGPDRPTGDPSSLYGLEDEERARIGTEDDPLRNFEAAMQRNEEAELAIHNGDTERAIKLYKISIREEFVGSLTSGSPPSTKAGTTSPKPSGYPKPSQSSPPAESCPAGPNAPPTVSSPSSRPVSNDTDARSKKGNRPRSQHHVSHGRKPPYAGKKCC